MSAFDTIIATVNYATFPDANTSTLLLNPQALIQPHPKRGESVLIPGKSGRLARPLVNDEMEVDLQFALFGSAYSRVYGGTAIRGLEILKLQLRQTLLDDTANRADSNGTLSFYVTSPYTTPGTYYKGRLQTISIEFGDGVIDCNAVVKVRIAVPPTRTNSYP